MLTLFHHSLPPWAGEYGGWKLEKTADYFLEFTRFVINHNPSGGGFTCLLYYLVLVNAVWVMYHVAACRQYRRLGIKNYSTIWFSFQTISL